jgi:hypothetical protein
MTETEEPNLMVAVIPNLKIDGAFKVIQTVVRLLTLDYHPRED